MVFLVGFCFVGSLAVDILTPNIVLGNAASRALLVIEDLQSRATYSIGKAYNVNLQEIAVILRAINSYALRETQLNARPRSTTETKRRLNSKFKVSYHRLP